MVQATSALGASRNRASYLRMVSNGGPSATIRPPSRRTARSQNSAMGRGSCDTSSIDRPDRWRSRYRASHRVLNPASPTAKISSRIRHVLNRVKRDRIREPGAHAARVVTQLQPGESLELGKGQDLVTGRAQLAQRKAHDRPQQLDVVDRVQVRVPADTELEDRRHRRADRHAARVGRIDARERSSAACFCHCRSGPSGRDSRRAGARELTSSSTRSRSVGAPAEQSPARAHGPCRAAPTES